MFAEATSAEGLRKELDEARGEVGQLLQRIQMLEREKKGLNSKYAACIADRPSATTNAKGDSASQMSTRNDAGTALKLRFVHTTLTQRTCTSAFAVLMSCLTRYASRWASPRSVISSSTSRSSSCSNFRRKSPTCTKTRRGVSRAQAGRTPSKSNGKRSDSTTSGRLLICGE